ncbi:hypothetical protein ACTMTF_40385 [Nonomuraea sp. ZG12]|uniref:hypothetical protein n=1 Tax=Nonomuraea sp. ZG12 TaxID=3452207 RepID=UPI003F8C47FF
MEQRTGGFAAPGGDFLAAKAVFTGLGKQAGRERIGIHHVLLGLLSRRRPDPAAVLLPHARYGLGVIEFDRAGMDGLTVRGVSGTLPGPFTLALSTDDGTARRSGGGSEAAHGDPPPARRGHRNARRRDDRPRQLRSRPSFCACRDL